MPGWRAGGIPRCPSAFRQDIGASQIQHRLLLASEADLAEATRRFHIVSRALRGERHDPVPCRTLRRWIAAYRAEQMQHEAAIWACCPSRIAATPSINSRNKHGP